MSPVDKDTVIYQDTRVGDSEQGTVVYSVNRQLMVRVRQPTRWRRIKDWFLRLIGRPRCPIKTFTTARVLAKVEDEDRVQVLGGGDPNGQRSD